MAALNEMGLLDKIAVVSTVSGGSVIGSLWAYSEDDFDSFAGRVTEILRSGLTRSIILHLFHPKQLGGYALYLLLALPVNLAAQLLRTAVALIRPLLGALRLRPDWLGRFQPPFCRWASRTTAFELVLEHLFYQGKLLDSPRRNGMDIVINSCELSTGTPFRATESGGWNYVMGMVPAEEMKVSTAVAASAAFPILLPALDLRARFRKNGKAAVERVLLTDGGVLDNLGISALSPNRDPSFRTSKYHVDYVVCSSAGQGRPQTRVLPYWLLPRLSSVTSVMFRKLQDSGYSSLHLQKNAGLIQGFALAYLGEDDSKVPERNHDFVPRERTVDYPTDFSPMAREDMEAICLRGKQLMTAMIKRYCSELLEH